MIPIETEGHTDDALIVVLSKDNLERMRRADPAEIELRKSGKNLVNPTLLLCYEDDCPEWKRLVHRGDLKAILEYLRRGFEFRPDRGDHDRGPESIAGGN